MKHILGWLIIAKILLLQHNQHFYLDVSVSTRERRKRQGENVGCVEVIVFCDIYSLRTLPAAKNVYNSPAVSR